MYPNLILSVWNFTRIWGFIHSSSWIIFVAYLFVRQARVDDMNIHDNVVEKQTYAMLEERRSQAGDKVGVGGGDRST